MKRNTLLLLVGFSLGAMALLSGCSHMPLFDPKGPIGASERFVIITSIVLMLIVIVPVIVMTFWFARRYRASNSKATYAPKWSHSLKIELIVWLVPMAIVMALGYLAWSRTFSLDPYRPIVTSVTPLRIEAVSLDWKWLFIYPDQGIASVNQLVFPANVPLSLRLTSDTVMTSFFIPQLGSQIYAMAGMQTRLHLLANKPGTYYGQNQQFSGRGYADMSFKAIATSRKDFDAWVQKAKQAPEKLDMARWEKLRKPSLNYPVTYFSAVTPALFDHILRHYNIKQAKLGAMVKKSHATPLKTGISEER